MRVIGLSAASGELKELLLAILRAYESTGEGELATRKLAQFLTARYGSVGESRTKVGDLSQVRSAYRQMQSDLYEA